jgi:protein-S-isoprenylcysteine O-methyltransferase Ste14
MLPWSPGWSREEISVSRAEWRRIYWSGHPAVILLKSLLFTFIVPGFVVGWVPHYFLMRRPLWPDTLAIPQWCGLAVFAVGFGIYLHCVWHFAKGLGTPAPIDPPKKLVHRGLYAWVRNPMYLGIVTIAAAEALFWQRAVLALYAVALACVFQLFVVLYEEPVLKRKFGAPYLDYLARVPRWLPRKPRPVVETVAPFKARER